MLHPSMFRCDVIVKQEEKVMVGVVVNTFISDNLYIGSKIFIVLSSIFIFFLWNIVF